jgi:glyoxylase-like metal-dependent hydrolase (beta-lactamase superfamily II)
VHPVRTGTIAVPPGFFQVPSGPFGRLRGAGLHVGRGRWTRVPVPAFVVEHPGAGLVLVDTGLHEDVARDPRRALGASALYMPPEMDAQDALPARLRALGLHPQDVAVVVMTHLHTDHASGIAAFPDATFVVDQREWDAACAGGLTEGYRHQLFDHPFDWRTLDFNAIGVSSFETFANTVDLFGDGSVRVVASPGHTLGHCSLLLRLGRGRELLLTADAAYSTLTIRDRLVPLFRADEHLYLRSLGEIRRFLERTPGAIVICGHDPEQWPRLEPVYD